MRSIESGASALVIGASGGIGAALVTELLQDTSFDTVFAGSRAFDRTGEGKLRRLKIDVTDEASLVQAAHELTGPIRLVIVATGLLHGPAFRPEKSLKAVESSALLESFKVNAIGPALVAKHMLPLMAASGRNVFAALSARVGSIGDNRSGGWHAYRASKAALNMIIRNIAIETSRRAPETLCIGLHPGTVDTGLSKPFQANVPPGRMFTPGYAATCLLNVIDTASASDSGNVLAWDGQTVPP